MRRPFLSQIVPQPSSQDIVAKSNTVALDFGRAVLGPFGGVLFTAMVAISCFGAMNGDLDVHFPGNLHLYALFRGLLHFR